MYEQIEARVEKRGWAGVYGPTAVAAAKQLAAARGWGYRDCTTADGFVQGILYR